MRKIFLTFGLVVLLTSPAFAQSVKDKLLALSEGLNDPNPIIRISVLDAALADSSSTVRNYAMSQALASEDADLKSMALTKFFETRKQLTVIVKKPEALKAREASLEGDTEALEALKGRSESYSYGVLTAYQPSIMYILKSFNSTTGELKGNCMKGEMRINEYSKFSGSVVGNKVTIEHTCQRVASRYDSCTLQMQLSDSAKFVGTMRCAAENYPAVVELPLK